LRDLGINEFASPKIGDSFVTKSVAGADPDSQRVTDIRSGKSFVPVWSFHFAGVVAKSGDDVVTLENYARVDEDKNLHGATPQHQHDPRWFFQMYSVKNAKQTFHQAQIASGGFANPMTMALRNPRRQPRGLVAPVVPQPVAIPPRAATQQIVAGSALLMMIAGVVLRRHGLI
jgi:hypothetical protein